MLKSVSIANKKSRTNPDDAPHDEYQYLNLVSDVITDGFDEVGRNGSVKCVYGAAMHFSLEEGVIPILTTKRTAWKTCLKELLWFIQGKMDNKILNEQKVRIWDANCTPEFLESRNLRNLTPGDLGPLYGFQWRHFNAPYRGCDTDYTGEGVDQLQKAIDILRDPAQRTSRRIIVSAWNPCQVDEGVLPSCHNFFQFNVVDGNKLSCSLTQRSGDLGLGVPFNIASYAFLTHLIAKHCNLIPYEFIHFLGNCHVYSQHIDVLEDQVSRKPYPFPTLTIGTKRDNINDYVIDDFILHAYESHPPIKMDIVA